MGGSATVCPTGRSDWSDRPVERSLGRSDQSVRQSERVNTQSRSCDISELEVFRMLDRLQPTTTGPELIPSWFLRLGASVFSAPLAQLFNQSIHSGVVPRQWKSAFITPLPKIAHPAEPSDFRPSPSPLFYRGPLRDTLSERTSTRLCNNPLQTCNFQTSLLLDPPALPQQRSYHSCSPSTPC